MNDESMSLPEEEISVPEEEVPESPYRTVYDSQNNGTIVVSRTHESKKGKTYKRKSRVKKDAM